MNNYYFPHLPTQVPPTSLHLFSFSWNAESGNSCKTQRRGGKYRGEGEISWSEPRQGQVTLTDVEGEREEGHSDRMKETSWFFLNMHLHPRRSRRWVAECKVHSRRVSSITSQATEGASFIQPNRGREGEKTEKGRETWIRRGKMLVWRWLVQDGQPAQEWNPNCTALPSIYYCTHST